MTAPPAGSQAVDRACALLAEVVQSARPRTFTSLVDELGLARSTTSRLLAALERNRLVQRDSAGGFRPGPLFAAYAARQDGDGDLVELTRSSLERLGRATGETVNLAVPRGSVVQIAQVDSSFLLGASNWVGVAVPAHCTALGKVFYAYDALPMPNGPLERRTASSPTTLEALARDLHGVRRRGWALAWEELEPGLVAVAAPIRSGDGRVVAAISITGPTARIQRSDIERLAALLINESRNVCDLLAHPGSRRQPTRGKEGAA